MSIFDTTPLIEKDEANALIAKLFVNCPHTSEYLSLAEKFWSMVVKEHTIDELTYEKIDLIMQDQLQIIEKALKVCDKIISWTKNNVVKMDKNGNFIKWELSTGTMRNFCGVKITLKESSLFKGSVNFSGVLEVLSPYRVGDKRFFPENIEQLFSVEKTEAVKTDDSDEEGDSGSGSGSSSSGGSSSGSGSKLTEDEAKYLIAQLINSCPKTSEFLSLATQFWSLDVTYHANDQTYSTAMELTDKQIELVEKAKDVCSEIISWMGKNSAGKDSHGNKLKWKFSLGSMRNFYAVKIDVSQKKLSFTGVLEIFSAYRDGDNKYFPENISSLFSTEKVTTSNGGGKSDYTEGAGTGGTTGSSTDTDTGTTGTDTGTDTGTTGAGSDTGVTDTDTGASSGTTATSGTTLADSTYGLTDWIAFTKGAKKWGIEMERVSSASEIYDALKENIPAIVLHPKGILGEAKQFVVYAKLSGEDDLIINSPSSPNKVDGGPDTKTWSLSEVLKDATKDGGKLIAWIPTTENEKKSAAKNSAKKTKESQYEGYKVKEMGEMVEITALPKGLTYCEPIYPDFVMVGDSVPEWASTAAADIAGQAEDSDTSAASSDTVTGNSTTDKTQS